MTDDEVEQFERGWRIRVYVMLTTSLIAIVGLAWYGHYGLALLAVLVVAAATAALMWLRACIRRG